jgi:hypothetical protein
MRPQAPVQSRATGRRIARSVVAFVLASIVSAFIGAAPGATGTSTEQNADTGTIPRTAEGKPDFSGIWQTLSAADYGLEPHGGRQDAPPFAGVVEGGEIPYQPWALEQRNRNFAARATEDPRTKCFTLGTPRGIYYREPFQIFQRAEDLTVLFQFGHSVRTIHTNGTDHQPGPLDFWAGDSRGRWEGDTLVVDVVHFNGQTWLDRAGNFHSDALRVRERWNYVDANTIRYQATLEDEKVYTRPWTISLLLHRHREPAFQLIENYCFTHEYDKYYPVPE